MRRAILAFAMLGWPAVAQVPAPRAWAPVDGAVVTLGDLFENAGPRADTPLGPSPAPGRRFVVEAPQLAMIARDYGLAWQPLGGEDRVVVERPGRAMAVDAVLEPLKAELVLLGADPAQEVDMPGFTAPMLPALAPDARVAIDAARWDAATRRFSATLVIVAEGMPTLRQRVAGRMVEMRDVVVATRALRRGDVLEEADVVERRLPLDRVQAASAGAAEEVLGQRLRRNVTEGQALRDADVAAVPLVARDSMVLLVHEGSGFTLTAQARALEDGFRGRGISVLNLASGIAVRAEVLDARRVRAIGPDTAPRTTSLAARAARRESLR
ncbi:flagellar basal body P-ring formation protein FlgA [Roseomonas frigidaquae]|uniref:Flagellar basal body P-ring formation protein FlgA n=1 Tax=Falsiroseomonas frigidaquae TaxID=487318 RepID=A0ABX1EVS4_9PROT|nr:flagellar basal body P-ring formation chaperone FlgA [Falsiroseomonas frigidaquae]NKE43280.1 flagellar basal body P-ring formation protein FlgA [Falsiroseomonas frigidaquae]